jgi:hypothetical protein
VFEMLVHPRTYKLQVLVLEVLSICLQTIFCELNYIFEKIPYGCDILH